MILISPTIPLLGTSSLQIQSGYRGELQACASFPQTPPSNPTHLFPRKISTPFDDHFRLADVVFVFVLIRVTAGAWHTWVTRGGRSLSHIKYGSIFDPQLVISPWCPHNIWKHIRATTGHYCNSTATVPHQCQNSSPIVYELNINLHILHEF